MRLWNAIFEATRVDRDDPVQDWKEHSIALDTIAKRLNQRQYKALHYRSKGTDITVNLPNDHIWVSAGNVNQQGISFIANMPTEEVFTSPLKTGVNGTKL
jgi:aminopeptidase